MRLKFMEARQVQSIEQSDWSEDSDSQPSYILNKPDLAKAGIGPQLTANSGNPVIAASMSLAGNDALWNTRVRAVGISNVTWRLPGPADATPELRPAVGSGISIGYTGSGRIQISIGNQRIRSEINFSTPRSAG